MRLEKEGMFTGIEREGKYAGTPTLFIQGCLNWDVIRSELVKHPNIRHLEFGSGRYLAWSYDALTEALDSDLVDLVTVETGSISCLTDYQLAHPKIHLFVTLLMPECHGCAFWHIQSDERLIQKFNENSNIEIKIATGVWITVINVNGISSHLRNDIFFEDKKA